MFRTTICTLLVLGNLILSAQTYGDISAQQGIVVSNPGGLFGNGVSFADFDRDGWDDLSFCIFNGPPQFYKNYEGQYQILNLDIDFPSDQDCKCILWCDFDNDGDQDLFITYRNSPVAFYRNEGNMAFTEVSSEIGLLEENVEHFGASFGDINNDGWLDLFVCKYHNEDNLYQYANKLYLNNQDGTFTDVTQEAGLDDVYFASFQSAFYDYDKDGHLDLFVINDRLLDPNSLYRNNGDGTFANVTTEMNVEHYMDAMCVTMGDFDNDTDLDVYISNSEIPGNALLENQSGEIYIEVASDVQLQVFEQCWGSLWMDYDNNGWLDLYVCSTDNVGPDFSNPNVLYANENADFGNITSVAGLADDITISYCVAMGDVNNDGFPDFAQHNFAPTNSRLYQNSSGSNNWLKVELEGVVSNLDGIGSYVYVYVDGQTYTRYTQCGQNFLSQDSHRKMFGLGEAEQVDSVIIDWPSGHQDVLYNVQANQTLEIQEGTSIQPLISQSGPLCSDSSIELSTGDWTQYLWSTGDTIQSIIITEPGFYWAQVANEFGFWSPTVQITIDWSLIPSYNVLTNVVSCSGDSTGMASVIFDLPGDNLITWSSGVTGNTLDSLQAGTYHFEIENVDGCTLADSVTVSENTEIVSELFLTHVSCFGEVDGTMSTLTNGGVLPYDIEVLTGDSAALSAGIYELVVTDSLGCMFSTLFEITEPDLLEITLETTGANAGNSGTATQQAEHPPTRSIGTRGLQMSGRLMNWEKEVTLP
jgi:hypothetical protein